MPCSPAPRSRSLSAILCCMMLFYCAQPAGALEKATVQLKWLHHFQFAGYYAALEKGFYKQAGLDVTILEGGPTTEVEQQVVDGKADFGVGTSALLLHRAHGSDLVVLGQIFQHSPAVFLTPRKTGIRSVKDMAGRRIMYSNQHGDMLALLRKSGIDDSKITSVPHYGDARDLISGKADVMMAYSFNEPFALEQVGEPYLLFSPMTYGIDFYGDNFFTTRKLINSRPEFVKAFREATLRGWQYALRNKAEIADLILVRYSQARSRDWLLFEANQMETLIQPNLVELGYQNPARWQHIADTFSGLGMLPAGFDPSAIIYAPKPPKDYRLLIGTTAILSMIIAILTALTLTFRNLNRRLLAEISERKQAESALKDSESKFSVAFHAAPLLMTISRIEDGTFLEANEHFYKVSGFSREELIGKSSLKLGWISAEDRERLAAQLSTEGRIRGMELFLKTRQGSEICCLYSGEIIELNGTRRLLSIGLDISEHRMMQAELIKHQKLESLGVLAGGIAHDFNNLLTGILGNISFARAFLDESQRASRILLEAEKASLRATDLTHQLLTFAKGGQPVKKTVSIRQILEASASLVLSGSSVGSAIDINDDLHAVEADEGQLSQTFNNIIINAVQAMPAGGTISIQAANVLLDSSNPFSLLPGAYAKINFSDTGCGIPEEDQKRIFDPYFTTKSGGHGLGLATAHSIISRHNGQISVHSKPGSGTTFEILLPASSRKTIQPEETMTTTELTTAESGAALLVMDDEEMIRNLMSDMLDEVGYRVQCCVNGEEAITMYAAAMEAGSPFSAVIMDLTIPGGMGGREAAEQILKIDPRACLIVSSGYSNDPVMAEHAKFGFRATLVKPYRLDEIMQVLNRLLSESTA